MASAMFNIKPISVDKGFLKKSYSLRILGTIRIKDTNCESDKRHSHKGTSCVGAKWRDVLKHKFLADGMCKT